MKKSGKSIVKNWKLWIGVIIGIVVIVGIIIGIENSSKEVNSNVETQYNSLGKEIRLTNKLKKDMYNKVKQDIIGNLKTPSTAIFPDMKDWNIDVNSDNVIEVKSYVDSQNSYGAMLRANFKQKYIYFDKDEYICIYKDFNSENEFDITENTEYKRFINKEINDTQMEDFIDKSKDATIYGNLIDYNFNKENQNLEINVLIKKIDSPYFDYKSYINSVICAYINQCICIPTITTKLNVKNEKNEILATVSDINIEFLLNDWYILWDMGIMNNTDGTNLEEKLKERLWIKSEIE